MALATGIVIATATSGIALGFSGGNRLCDYLADVALEETPEAPPICPPAGGAQEPDGTLYQGFSMEDARKRADEGHSRALKMTPREVLADLQRGNARFWTNSGTRPDTNAFDRRALISKQFPTVALLCCADSRVPPELIFDQGLGSLFVVRVAGNAVDTATMASLQYAVHHLKVKVLVVLGHELCGAIKAAQLPLEKLQQEPKELSEALTGIKQLLNQGRFERTLDDSRAHDREAVTTNVKKQVETLARNPGLMAKVASQELLMVGGFYDISSGIVDIIAEVVPQ